LNNEGWYKKKGIPYNIGFLFHGTPGCGKTSCIKAISNFTNRHVVEINLSKIKKCKDFIKIFNHNCMNEDYVPHDKKIIVLEDIDCMIDIVKSRINKEDENEEENKFKIDEKDNDMVKMMKIQEKGKIIEFEHFEKMEKKKEEKEDDKLTLSCILNTIDGVLENYGRILIITTNHVEKLDSALIRPGRIDMKVNFTKCSRQMYYDIIEHYYEKELQQNIPFVEYKHSPAEVLEICSLHNENIFETIDILTKNNKDNFEVM
jgi:chaperone BCS1